MQCNKAFLFSVLAVLVVPSVTPCPLYMFARWRMTSLWQWMSRYNPSPLREGPDTFAASGDVANLQVEIRNHGISGHSGDMAIKGGSTSVYNDTKRGVVDSTFFLIGNITFFGEYSAFGTINSRPVSVQGQWHISVPRMAANSFTFQFETTSEGFLRIFDHYLYQMTLFDRTGMSVYFENLSDHQAAVGYEEEISETLVNSFQTYLVGDNSDHPFRKLYLQFWEEILAETRFEDING